MKQYGKFYDVTLNEKSKIQSHYVRSDFSHAKVSKRMKTWQTWTKFKSSFVMVAEIFYTYKN